LEAVQDVWLPGNACFGCGPANHQGFRLKSYPEGDELVATWTVDRRYQGPPGVVQGGVLAIPMDCHATWTAMFAFARATGADEPIPAVTTEYRVRLRRPTPTGKEVVLRGVADDPQDGRVAVRVTATVDGEVTATFEGRFIAIPGYGAWDDHPD
jgi:acyl-coenzyme A thioesterase PaaI-like protein